MTGRTREQRPPPGRRTRRWVGISVIAFTVLGLVVFTLNSVGVLPTTGGYRILFVGASVTEGYYASSPADAYPADTVRALEDRGIDVEPLVVAKAGSGTGNVLRWRLQGSPDAIVLQIATNDFGKLPVDRFSANYIRILTILRSLGPTARLLCLGAWRSPTQVNKLGESTAQFNQATQSDCGRFRGRFVNLSAIYLNPINRGPKGRETSYGPADDYHPNDRGHRLIANLVVQNLAPLPSS